MSQSLNPDEYGYTALSQAQETDPHPHLMLGEETLNAGKSLILCLRGVASMVEVVGHVEIDRDGWFLDTGEVAIMLHAGLWARLPREGGRTP
jgi:hypothetical protein